MSEPIALLALSLDAAVGWPARLYRLVGHPVDAFARMIGSLERHWNKPADQAGLRKLRGVLTLLLLAGITVAICFALERGLNLLLGSWAWIGVAILAWPALAQRSLYDHVRPVAQSLERGELDQARASVGMIVGRDTGSLDHAGVARAAIESLAESFCDGVVAPLFWLIILGLPGVWAYKAINTADSLIGHREERWRAFGWAAARTDDIANWVPARISAVLLCLAGGRGWRIMCRDCHQHASPNAGWPEAAMAGALGIALAGPVSYEGVILDKAWIGAGSASAQPRDVERALALYVRACALLWLLAGIVAWLR